MTLSSVRQVSFIFTDNEIKDESFLEYINNVLSAGEVANLFPRDEMDDILDQLIPIMKKLEPKRPPTRDNLNAFFLARARANLHVVLCFSPVCPESRNHGFVTYAILCFKIESKLLTFASILSIGWREVPHPCTQIPGSDIGLHHRLVLPVAKGRPGGRVAALPGKLRHRVHARGEGVPHGPHGGGAGRRRRVLHVLL